MTKYKGLSKAQQNLLDEEGEDCFDVDELPTEVFEELKHMNNHELLIQAANRYLGDKAMVKAHSVNRW